MEESLRSFLRQKADEWFERQLEDWERQTSFPSNFMKRQFTKEQQESILKRDEYCQLCGCPYNLSKPHHIFYGNHTPKGWMKGDDINGEWNGVILCWFCHQGFHHTAKFGNGKSLKENRNMLEEKAQLRFMEEYCVNLKINENRDRD